MPRENKRHRPKSTLQMQQKSWTWSQQTGDSRQRQKVWPDRVQTLPYNIKRTS